MKQQRQEFPLGSARKRVLFVCMNIKLDFKRVCSFEPLSAYTTMLLQNEPE